MPKEAPSFSNAQYWDKRFQENSKSFDWLMPESCFDDDVKDFLNTHDGNDSSNGSNEKSTGKDVLHIGPGTSMLSFHLKTIMGAEYRIHNVDFSHEAVKWGMSKEKEIQSAQESNAGQLLQEMRWSQVSLLSLPSVLSAATQGSVGLIIDKSTSDAIACGVEVCIHISPPSDLLGESSAVEARIHPLHILALNLAIVAAPKARWLCLSYSKERFPFLPTLFAPFPDPLPDGVPDPKKYWKLKRQRELQTEQEVPEKFRTAFNFVHRPVTLHYLYILERTELELNVEEVESLGAEAQER